MALAFPAVAQTNSAWTVDVARYGYAMPSLTEDVGRGPTPGLDYQVFHVGQVQFYPWVKSMNQVYFRTNIAEVPQNMRTIEMGVATYTPAHPRFAFVGRYVYRQLPKDTDTKDAITPYPVRGIKTPSEWSAEVGIVCQFPITTCTLD